MPTTRIPLSSGSLLVGLTNTPVIIHQNTGGVNTFDDLYLTIHNITASTASVTFNQVSGATTTQLDVGVAIGANRGVPYSLGFPVPNNVSVTVTSTDNSGNIRVTGYALRNS